jgi:N-acetylglucosamine-6-phosphate deacetylase
MSLLVHNVRRVDADGVVDDGWVSAVAGEIREVGTGSSWRELADPLRGASAGARVTVDGHGATLVPGFLDLHAHGGGGHRFEDGPNALEAALLVHRRHGVTRSVVSLASSPLESMTRSLGDVAELAQRDRCVLGAHLEGPYLSSARRGAHDPSALRLPLLEEVEALVDASRGQLRQLTIAPELPGALEVIGWLAGQGVVVAVGHTEADYARTRAAFDAGASLLTHAFNAMPGIGHRAPGPVVAAFDDETVCLEVINDGQHVDPRVVALTFAQAPGRVAMVSDAMAAAGLGDGIYRLGASEVTVKGGVARIATTGSLAGSTSTLDESLGRAVAAGIAPVQAVAAVTAVPAGVLGLGDHYGRLRPGYAADLVVLDAQWQVTRVFAAGLEIR